MNIEKSIVSTPIDFPKLVPDDWDKWWSIWNLYAKPLTKVKISPNQASGLHLGFDVIRAPAASLAYSADYVDLCSLYPSLYAQIAALPVPIYVARFVSSQGHFLPHIDNHCRSWSLRSMFYCADPNPQWYYSDLNGGNKSYLRLPEDTNWWAYLDGAIKHGTIYRAPYPKIILQIFSESSYVEEFVRKSFGKFENYVNRYDIDN